MSKNTVLIVEDEEDIRTLLLYNIGKEGFSVTAVESGELGLQHAIANHPDLIILDLMLPGMDGLSVCRTLKNSDETRNIPIIIASAKGEEADIITGLEMATASRNDGSTPTSQTFDLAVLWRFCRDHPGRAVAGNAVRCCVAEPARQQALGRAHCIAVVLDRAVAGRDS